jgi:hypothetical protein
MVLDTVVVVVVGVVVTKVGEIMAGGQGTLGTISEDSSSSIDHCSRPSEQYFLFPS